MKAKVFSIIWLLAIPLSVVQAEAVQYGFYNITNENAGDAAIGEAQLFVDVTEVDGQAQFLFKNIGPAASSITDIYFDDDIPLMSFNKFIYPTSGVVYDVNATPPDLSGGNDYHFSSDYDFDSDAPVQPNGINPNEQLIIVFDYASSYNMASIFNALDNGSMRIGLHVQGFASGGSESFLNTPGNPVPEPATMLLFGAGIAGIAGMVRRKSCVLLIAEH